MNGSKETCFNVVKQNVAVQIKPGHILKSFFLVYFPGNVAFSLGQIVSQYTRCAMLLFNKVIKMGEREQ